MTPAPGKEHWEPVTHETHAGQRHQRYSTPQSFIWLSLIGTCVCLKFSQETDAAGAENMMMAAQLHEMVAPRPNIDKPKFTVGDLRRAIPAHCFERSLLKSAQYLLLDLIAVATLFAFSTFIDKFPVPVLVRAMCWALYWFFQGAVCTGVWVIAHECGHQAFSSSQLVNDTVGFILHSCLLVPYFSWKHSHRRHHSNTGNVVKDEVFVPTTDSSDIAIFLKYTGFRAGWLAFQSLLGWPLYLLYNASGREYSRPANHFDPTSPIFSRRERPGIVLSDLGLLAVGYGLYNLGQAFGGVWLIKTYFIPYLIVNFWLVTITFLQHTHPNLPHYEDEQWDWVRGALATVDRSYGFLDVLFHHIADTHVAHHLFSQMPHYHAQEATEALKPILGDYYCKDSRNVLQALWQEMSLCHYVAPEQEGSGVLWFHTHTNTDVVTATAAVAAGFNADKAAKVA